MAAFTVWIARVAGNEAWQAMFEVANTVVYALRRLGHDAELVTRNPGITARRLIIFNSHCLPADWKIPADAILFNAEQVPTTDTLDSVASAAMWQHILPRLRQHIVWDYSETNLERLREFGVDRAVHCRVGYCPESVFATASMSEDLDVLFVGLLNNRRAKVLQQIDRKMNLKVLSNAYGEERDRWISRAKVVLNIHFYPEPIFEIFRVSHLLANRKCVVTEDGGRDKELETLAMATTSYVFYENIADECARLVKDADRRREIATRGHEIFSKLDAVEFVRDALGKS